MDTGGFVYRQPVPASSGQDQRGALDPSEEDEACDLLENEGLPETGVMYP